MPADCTGAAEHVCRRHQPGQIDMLEIHPGLDANHIAATVECHGTRYPSATHSEADWLQRDLAVHDRQVHDEVVERH